MKPENPKTSPAPDRGLTLREVAAQAGVPLRTVRYYLEHKVLTAQGRGPGARYPAGYVQRIRLTRQWQAEGRTLPEIGPIVANMTDEQVLTALGTDAVATPPLDAPTLWENHPIADGLQLQIRRPADPRLGHALAGILVELRKIVGAIG